MPTAQGIVKALGGSKFAAAFHIDETQYTYSANIDPSVEPFNSNGAILIFDSASQLIGTYEYDGKVGTNDVKLSLANGPTIEGQLDAPISSESAVNGSGTWTTG
ncbi:hypothetical protein RSAG8_08777, partial [Rhizoctonia solani AG-8 WAC10335]